MILIVDDEKPILDLLQDILEDAGYEVLVASNGEAALSIVEQKLPELILTDLMMPGMDGQTLCTRLRANPRTSHIPILLMTAARQPTINAPFTDMISKPFTLEGVLSQIQKYIP